MISKRRCLWMFFVFRKERCLGSAYMPYPTIAWDYDYLRLSWSTWLPGFCFGRGEGWIQLFFPTYWENKLVMPKCSTYGIFASIWPKSIVSVGKYSIRGAYWDVCDFILDTPRKRTNLPWKLMVGFDENISFWNGCFGHYPFSHNHGSGKSETNIGGTHFPLPWLWEEW